MPCSLVFKVVTYSSLSSIFWSTLLCSPEWRILKSSGALRPLPPVSLLLSRFRGLFVLASHHSNKILKYQCISVPKVRH
ncbi:hypothetical protein L873DRAFT_378566 [Choiromyces venosus 120613-1]|uniref:Uncharacterized protein n=1 Tax=Choiromyces venosus 120613-1 TaxID=1336337 RepID=A0A3N4J1B2_9PEZI|nr:hypothetical protein L873DRAFT_378566 [Choiromyces venosus 120613-1]